MAHVVKFPAPPIDRLAENCIERILEPEIDRVRAAVAAAESRSMMLTIVDDALYAVARRLSTEAIEARESELAALHGTPEWEGVRVV